MLKLNQYMEIKGLGMSAVAKHLDLTHTHIYNYLYEGVYPKHQIMMQIFVKTQGIVTPNDFHDATPEYLAKKLLEEKIKLEY